MTASAAVPRLPAVKASGLASGFRLGVRGLSDSVGLLRTSSLLMVLLPRLLVREVDETLIRSAFQDAVGAEQNLNI